MKRKFLIFLNLAFICITNLFSYQAEHFILQNSLEIFTIQDKNTTICKVYYINDAGYSIQNPETTGFAELYQKLFWKTNPNFDKKSSALQMTKITSYCQQEKAIFCYDVVADYLEDSIKLLSEQLKNPTFKNEDITTTLTEIKKREAKLHSQPEGFITSTIDMQVFESSPWEHASSTWPELLGSYKAEKARMVLTKIQKEHYCSEKSTLVIVSPYTDEEVLDFVKSSFDDWQKSGQSDRKNGKVAKKSTNSESTNDDQNVQKKFVLVTDAISEELIQIVVQYADENIFYKTSERENARRASLVLENNASRFKKLLCANKKLGIIDEEYVNVNFSESGKTSRVVIQSLLQTGLELPSVQEEDFMNTLLICTNFTDDEIFYAQNEIEKQNKFAQNSSSDFAQSVIYNLGYGSESGIGAKNDTIAKKDIGTKNDDNAKFYDNILRENDFFFEDEQLKSDIKAIFREGKSYIFLLVNPKVYKRYANDFAQNKFTVLNEKNSLWYKQGKYKDIAISAQKAVIRSEFNGETYATHEKGQSTSQENLGTPNERLVKNFEENSYSFLLSNGIPVFVQSNEQVSSATLLLHFDEGEYPYPKNKRAMGTVLLKTFAKNIEKQMQKAFFSLSLTDMGNIQVESGIYSSFISISCLQQDFETICRCINHAIAYPEITPAMEDEIILQEKSIWQFTSSQLLFQLKCKFLSNFFASENHSYLFSCTADILQDVNFNEIASLYEQILDASKITILVAGNTGKNKTENQKLLEKSLSMIPKITQESLKKNGSSELESGATENSTSDVGASGVVSPENSEHRTELGSPENSEHKTEVGTSFFASDEAISVHLKRIFGSDIKAKDAGPRPEHLIPTTEFKDPAIVFFKSPSKTSDEYANFLLALTILQEKLKNEIVTDETKKLASDIQILQFDEIDSVTALSFSEVENSKLLYNYFEKTIQKTPNIINNELKNAKINYIGNNLGNLATSDDMAKKMNQNLCGTGNAFFYIDFLKMINDASLLDVQNVYKKYIEKMCTYWIFSADTKR